MGSEPVQRCIECSETHTLSSWEGNCAESSEQGSEHRGAKKAVENEVEWVGQ
jgi:hypothetical protein